MGDRSTDINDAVKSRCTILVHGGAWGIPDHLAEASITGVKAAARQGYTVLEAGGSAIDAVEKAVCCLEDDPAFDAGHGSVLNSLGEVEMDSVIMDGRDLNAGAIACVQNIEHPVSLARQVMEKTDHVLLVGRGANLFAKEVGMATVSADQLVTQAAREEWQQMTKFNKTIDTFFQIRSKASCDTSGHDTVGAVAMDAEGNIAFATSTGGITAKRPGRVGDSPLLGCGGYCDNNAGGVSTTGHGEAITRVCLAKRIVLLMEQGMSAQEASDRSLSYMSERVDGSGGVITLSKAGEMAVSFTTERMAWATVQHNTLTYGLEPQQELAEPC